MKSILGTFVMAAVLFGAALWLGDGVKPWEDGWYGAATDKFSALIGYSGETVENKLPDPAQMDLPHLDDAIPQGDQLELPPEPQMPELEPAPQGGGQ